MGTRKLIVEVVGDSRSLERSFSRSSRAAKTFGNETTSSLARVEAGFGKLQRIAAGGFIGGAALVAVRQFVTLGAESQKVLGQTRVAVESAGQSWERYGQTIQDTIQKQSKLGFDDEALLRTFSLFVRQTDDVGEALRRNNLAMDVARARFIDLEQAAQLVNKAALGQAGALRRVGIDAKNGASGVELLAKLQQEFGGSAVAAADDASTAMDRFNVSVENLQEALGTLLLPAISDIADGLADGADQAQVFVTALQKLGDVKIPTIHIPLVADFGGGTIGGATGSVVGEALKTAVKVQFFGIGLAAASIASKAFGDGAKQGAKENPLPDLTQTFGINALGQVDAGNTLASSFSRSVEKAMGIARKAVADAIKKGKAAQSADAKAAAKQSQRDAFDNLIDAIGLSVDQATATKGIADDLRRNTELQNAIKAQIKVEGRTTELSRQLFEARQARAQIVTDGAAAVTAANRKAEAAQRAALQASQFRALGLTPGGEQRIPTVGNLSKQLDQLGKRDLSAKAESQLARIGKVLSGSFGKVTEETRSAIQQLFATIRGELDKGANGLTKGPLTKTHALSASKILAGLGLGRDVEKELAARLSKFNTAGLGLAGAPRMSGSFVGQAIVVENHNTVTLDGDVVGKSVTRSQQKTGRRNPPQRRGPNARSGI